VPLARNDGEPVTDTELGAIEDDLFNIAGGFTSTDSTGAWRSDDGTVYREPVRVYAVDVADAIQQDAGERLLSLAEFVATALEQEAVYLTAGSIVTRLVTKSAVLR
jgi:hypothetical protein